MSASTFRFHDGDEDHAVGDMDCRSCFNAPTACRCGGVIHAEYLDEDWDSVFTSKQCDKCDDAREAE